MKSLSFAGMAVWLTACNTLPGHSLQCANGAMPEPGSHQKLRAAVAVADNLEVIVSDVFIPPGAAMPRHYHPGEEFVYVIAGSATLTADGQPDRELTAGQAYVIAAEAVHAPSGGPDGGRAVVFRLHVAGREERYPAPD